MHKALHYSSTIGTESKLRYEGGLITTDELIGQDSGGR